MTFFYPDISYYQSGARIGDILNQSDGVLAIRAGDGDFKDPKFDTWRNQAANARILMIYLFVRKGDGGAKANADFLISHVGGKRRANEVFVCDAEAGGGSWSASEIRTFNDRVRSKLGGPPLMVYSNEGYAKGRPTAYTSKTGWIAKWGQPGKDTSKPSIPHIAWQHAADGYGKPRVHWAGCSTEADENRVDGYTPATFAATLLGTTTPPPPTVSSDCCS